MWKYNCEKRNKYYDEVIRLYTQEGIGCTKISRIIPVGETTISRWIRNFAAENNLVEHAMNNIEVTENQMSEYSDNIKELKEKIRQLEKELKHERLRADVYNELINVAEENFKIQIRKKAGAKQ